MEHVYQPTKALSLHSPPQYTPLALPTAPRSVVHHRYSLCPLSCKILIFCIARHTNNPAIISDPKPCHHALRHSSQQHKGLHQYITFHKPQDPLSPEECPPTHATRYICSVLQAVNVWHHPSALACFPTLSQHPAWDFMNSDTTAAQHALSNIHDIPNPKSIPSHLHPWYWSTSQHPLPNFYTVATARFHRFNGTFSPPTRPYKPSTKINDSVRTASSSLTTTPHPQYGHHTNTPPTFTKLSATTSR